jgi:hypothetical protein
MDQSFKVQVMVTKAADAGHIAGGPPRFGLTS